MKFKHYKGGVYEFVSEAILESDLTPMIVYRAADGSVWIRPKTVFHEMVHCNGQEVPRFSLVVE